VTDQDPAPDSTPVQKLPLRVYFAITIIIFAALVVLFVWTASPRVANAFTAAGTISLAVATVWLGLKTRDAVLVNEREMILNRETLSITRKQAENAELAAKSADAQVQLTSRALSLNSHPSVALEQGELITLVSVNETWVVVVSLFNYGAGAAIVETKEHLPKLRFFWDGEYEVSAMPESIVIPRGTGTKISFQVGKSGFVRRGLPETDEDGRWTHATLEYWTMDTSKEVHFRVLATFDSIEHHANPTVALFTLTDIDFDPPTVFATASVSFGFEAKAAGTVTNSAEIGLDWTPESPN
jgi:hypothetical protein